jgi:chemotaxis protein methyltransferase CheR
MAPSSSVEAIEIQLLLEAVNARYGYDFRGYAADSIGRRVKATLAKSGMPHLGELQHRVLNDPAVFASLVDELTVQVSEMFRSPSFYRAFREQVVPILRTYPQLKIWHAGCARGQEVYTTAIVLTEEGLYDRSQIYATDISQTALDQAREGVYPEEDAGACAVRYVEAGGRNRFDDFCSRACGRIAVREDLRKNIVFFQHDLVSDYSPGVMNVVFCRNVLIYFGPNLRERVLQVFQTALSRGGFLCLGESEGLSGANPDVFAGFSPSERIYRRRGEA